MENVDLMAREAAASDDTARSARAVGLRYIRDSQPGIRRKRAGRGFSYIDVDGRKIKDNVRLQRIKDLRIPPAWEDVWICPVLNGHLQATGRDARGRKQYLYHHRWRKVREEDKFNRMIALGTVLPVIRQTVEGDLASGKLSRSKVLATVVRLLEMTLIRIGNKEYARDNRSFGLTTLRDRHVDISGPVVRFHFRGKSGKEHSVEVQDRRLARIVKNCRDIPGYELFQYVDEEGSRRVIDSEDVNDYLREIAGEQFTAKDFRTWGGTVHAAHVLLEFGEFDSKTEAKKRIVQAVKEVSSQLGNKPSICRKYYIHPAVLEAYEEGDLPALAAESSRFESDDSPHSLSPIERVVMAVLKWDSERLAASA